LKLSAEQLASLATLLDGALDLSAEQQRQWLDALDPAVLELRPLLEKLLAEQDDSETQDLLARLPQWTRLAAEQRLAHGSPMQAGHAVGPYRLLRPLGRGGMGTVWLAERVDGHLKRSVALKLPFVGGQGRQLAERFERERDILAALEHRHIARLYDAGVASDGQPYLALEHVSGRPITEHCDANALDLRARVGLFLQVLQAVQYAHSRLVVHRDLKPSNIFVSAEGQVQLLDFGIATLLAEAGSSGDALTEFGAAALTPDYASPEQIAGRDIGTASDVYSLGVVFYELLSGRRPYRLARESRAALEQAILATDPARPSHVADAEAAALSRSARLPVLQRQLHGDLDNIALKALKKAPGERYGSAESFGQDLQRWLDGERVLAHPDSLAYRARKFALRHRLTLGMGALAGAALITGLGVAIWQADLARDQALLARREATKARAVQEFVVGLFNEADPVRAQGRQLTVRDLLLRGERDVQARLLGQPEVDATMTGVLADIYHRLGEDSRALALAQSRSELALKLHGATSLEYADAILSLGQIHGGMDHDEVALALLAQARTLMTPYAAQRQADLLQIPVAMARQLNNMRRHREALKLLLAAIPKLRTFHGNDSWEVVKAQSELAYTYADEDRFAQAAEIDRWIEPRLDSPRPELALQAAELREEIGERYTKARRWPEAIGTLTKVVADLDRMLGPDNSASIAALDALATARFNAGEFAQAAELTEANAERGERLYVHDPANAGFTQSEVVVPFILTGRLASAEAIGRQAVQRVEAGSALAAPIVQRVQRRLAMALIFNGKAPEAMRLLERILAAEAADHIVDNRHATTLFVYAGALNTLGRNAQAVAAAREAADIWLREKVPEQAAKARLTEALALLRLRGTELARARIDEAEALLGVLLPAQHVAFQYVAWARAELLRAQGHSSQADAQQSDVRQRFHALSGGVLPERLPLVL
jgi:eukaryotic-like serine/threonine-protein kinase